MDDAVRRRVRPLASVATSEVRLGLVLAIGALALGGVASASPRPSLDLASVNPLVVKGTGFRARERVTVTVATPVTTWHRALVATRLGSFRAAFTDAHVGRCALNIRAKGSRGSVATIKSPPLLACMP